jgi:hypothetical protein
LNYWNAGLDLGTESSVKAFYRPTLFDYRLFDCGHGWFPQAINLAGSKSLELKLVPILFEGDCNDALIDLIDISSNNQAGLWSDPDRIEV